MMFERKQPRPFEESLSFNRKEEKTRSKKHRGFTLIELLVVITIIGILASLLVPASMRARENGRQVKCSNNLHQLMLAMTTYESKYGTFPPGRVGCDCDQVGDTLSPKTLVPCKGMKAVKRPGTSGFALILPELDEVPLYQRFLGFQKGGVFPGDWAASSNKCDDKSVKGWQSLGANKDTNPDPTSPDSVTVADAVNGRPAVFNCPSNSATGGGNVVTSSIEDVTIDAGTTSYAMSMGSCTDHRADPATGEMRLMKADQPFMTVDRIKYANNGPFIYRTPRTTSAVSDGLGNTIFLGEVKVTDGTDHQPTNRWAVAWRLADSLRSTANGMNQVELPAGMEFPAGMPELILTSSNPEERTDGRFSSPHVSGAFFAFGDGHVTFLKEDIDLWLYRALSTIANGSNEAGFLTPPEN